MRRDTIKRRYLEGFQAGGFAQHGVWVPTVTEDDYTRQVGFALTELHADGLIDCEFTERGRRFHGKAKL